MKDDLKKEIEEISEYVKQHIPSDLNKMAEALEMLGSYLARSGELFAQSTTLYLHTRQKVLETLILQRPELLKSISILKDMADNLCAEENELVLGSERLNKAITHRGEWLRSNMSAEKTLMPSRNYQDAQRFGSQ